MTSTTRHYTRVTLRGTDMTRTELVVTDMEVHTYLMCDGATPTVFGQQAFLMLLNRWNRQVLAGNDEGARPIHVYIAGAE